MANMKLGIEITAQDNASKVVKTVGDNVAKTTKATEQQTVKSGKKMEDSYLKATRTFEQSYNQRKQAYRTMESYGLRSERAIQAEINRTRESYNRLRNSGVMSSRELARATEAHRRKIAELNAEMGKTSFGQKMGAVGRTVMGVGAGLAVGASMAARPIKDTADYQRELAYLANTAYADRDITGRQQGMDNIHAAIKDSLKYGGTKETAMEALSEIVSKGKVSVDDALKLLPTVQQNAMATGASSLDIAQLVNAGLNYGINPEQIQDFIDYANASGKAGGFELRDMAQYAPQIFSAAKGAGIEGMDGAKEIFKYLQQVYNVSGGSAETATNTINFLKKLNSQDTINRAEKIEYVDPKDGKKKGIDLIGSMKNYMASGQNTVEAFLSIVDQVLANDKEYQKLKQAVDKAKDKDAKKAALERIAGYVEGSKIGELVADQQAWMGLYGIRSQTQTAKNIDDSYLTAKGGTAIDGQLILNQAATKFEIASNATEMSKYEAFKNTTDFTGDVAQKLADYASSYPGLTNALVGATESIKILGSAAFAAAGSLAVLDLLKGKGGGLGSIFGRTTTTVGTVAATTTGNAITRAGTGVLSKAKGLINLPALAVTGLAIGADNATSYFAQKEAKDEQQADSKKQFYQAVTQQTAAKTDYWAGYQPPKLTTTQQAQKTQNAMALAYGGAAMALDNEVAAERVKQGTLSEADYQARINRNANRIEQWRNTTTDTPYQGLKNIDMTNAGNPLQQAAQTQQINHEKSSQALKIINENHEDNPVIKQTVLTEQVGNTEKNHHGLKTIDMHQAGNPLQRAVRTQQISHTDNSVQQSVPTKQMANVEKIYQGLKNIDMRQAGNPLQQVTRSNQAEKFDLASEVQSMGQTLSETLKRILDNQSYTLKNLITVELDGRQIAEAVSEKQYQHFVRG